MCRRQFLISTLGAADTATIGSQPRMSGGRPTVSHRAVASRYQPVLVALHWFLALMIIGLLCTSTTS
jgi:hypothetical protein